MIQLSVPTASAIGRDILDCRSPIIGRITLLYSLAPTSAAPAVPIGQPIGENKAISMQDIGQHQNPTITLIG